MAEITEINDQLRKHFIKLVSALRNDSSNTIYKALSQLRIDTEKNKLAYKYLCEINAFKILVKFLQLPNDKILNITLSLLANSSLNECSRKQIGESGVVPPLVSILKHIVQDSIQNRACRLAANLALSKNIAYDLYEHKAVSSIINVINSSNCPCTQQSAIRALRILWESSRNNNECSINIKDSMMAENVVKTVAQKLTSNVNGVTQNVLQAIALFTEYNPASCADQLKSVEGNGFALLLSKLPDSMVYQIMYNLSKSHPGAYYFNECHAVKTIIELLSDVENQKQKLLIYTLCLLCNDSSGSMQLLTAKNGLDVFLCLLEQSNSYCIRSSLYHVLLRFIFEPHILLKLTKLGLVKILTDKLEVYISKYGKEHQSVKNKEDTVKNQQKQIDECKWDESLIGQSSSSSTPKFDSRHKTFNSNFSQLQSAASPVSSSGFGSLSPTSSVNPSSPTLSDGSPYAFYSPVCSINSDDDSIIGNYKDELNDCNTDNFTELLSKTERMDENHLLHNIINPDNDNAEISNRDELGPISEGSCIVYILYKLSHISANVTDLSSKKTFMLLLQYIMQIRFIGSVLHVIQFFTSLVSKDQYYCALLDSQFAMEVHRSLCRPLHRKCNRCDELNEFGGRILNSMLKLSEAGLGEGQMAYRLLTGKNNIKMQIALTIPLVIRNANLLLKLLFRYKAMDTIVEKLLNYKELTSQSVEDIAYGLKILFINLKYENPQEETIADSTDRCIGCDIGKLRKESSIVFSLDDGSIVPANKTSLCNNSPVFEAMLTGQVKKAIMT
ncbi:BTB/POZ domain-containing protein Rnb isoform X2 [Lycorma delicatula]|uniref:BTB/POZ domain-containing protein Rnb isoform X2 n=1 Tax=Lycorma delicatula TaxID=130591 RepID=UPI003F519DE9